MQLAIAVYGPIKSTGSNLYAGLIIRFGTNMGRLPFTVLINFVFTLFKNAKFQKIKYDYRTKRTRKYEKL